MLVFKRDEAYIFQFDEALDDNLTGTSCICQFKKKLWFSTDHVQRLYFSILPDRYSLWPLSIAYIEFHSLIGKLFLISK